MQGKSCSISLKSEQRLGPESDTTIENYSGIFVERDGGIYLSYTRNSEEGDVKVLINASETGMAMTQKGMIQTKLEFIKGQKTYNDYMTPQGTLALAIMTHDYRVTQKGDFINIELRYDILFSDQPMETKMNISVKLI